MRILIASDGSASAAAAVDAAVNFPWPDGSRARGVVALGRVRWGATLSEVTSGSLIFVLPLALGIALLIAFPQIALFLPDLMLR